MARHKQAISNAWVGAAMTMKVVIDARSAKKPTFSDTEALQYMREILADGPKAVRFVQTSRETYDAYSEAFEFKAKVRVPSAPKLKPISGMSRA